MNESRTALIDLIDKIEQLGQFQDKIEFPASIPQIWEVFLKDVSRLVEVEGCALFMVDEATQEFRLADFTPSRLEPIYRAEIETQIECGIFAWVVQRRQPALIPSLAREQGKSVIMLPLSTGKRTLGVAMVVAAIQEGQLTHEKRRLLAVLARQCALVMENCILYEDLRRRNEALEKYNKQIQYLSQRDPLTGCYNRRYMNEHLPREIRRARRYRRELSIALCDIDHFKNINDTLGHAAGDRVLQQFVKSVNGLIRTDSDWLVRYGGEEFLVVLPETGLENALRLAERLRRRIADRDFTHQGETSRITASFGVIGFGVDASPEKTSAESLLRQADANLYRAKMEGRNRVVGNTYDPAGISSAPPPSEPSPK
jgi:diguanylate cyclase (GGDEF)-like protein